MGRRYSRQELEQIKALASEGLTNTEIAARLARARGKIAGTLAAELIKWAIS